jgi:hypothetical protein
MATREAIDKLKQDWKNDPIWDIEFTEGFEEHFNELLLFHKETERKSESSRAFNVYLRDKKVADITGITDPDIVKFLHTFEEIEHSCQFRHDSAELMQAQIRASLLQAAQLKRIAEALEVIAGREK